MVWWFVNRPRWGEGKVNLVVWGDVSLIRAPPMGEGWVNHVVWGDVWEHSKFVAWFDVQKRASTFASGLLFCLFPPQARSLSPLFLSAFLAFFAICNAFFGVFRVVEGCVGFLCTKRWGCAYNIICRENRCGLCRFSKRNVFFCRKKKKQSGKTAQKGWHQGLKMV